MNWFTCPVCGSPDGCVHYPPPSTCTHQSGSSREPGTEGIPLTWHDGTAGADPLASVKLGIEQARRNEGTELTLKDLELGSSREPEPLKACPFCGGVAKVRDEIIEESLTSQSDWIVECADCYGAVRTPLRHTAVENWNRRATSTGIPDSSLSRTLGKEE